MAVEAGRLALKGAPGVLPRAVYLSTTAPPYLDKTNATAVHAALRLSDDAVAADVSGAVRSGVAALRLALQGNEAALVVGADVRTGLPGSTDEAEGGDAAAAVLVGDDADGPVLAEHLGGASATVEFLDRWRTPGDIRSKLWEERFGESQYVPLAAAARRTPSSTSSSPVPTPGRCGPPAAPSASVPRPSSTTWPAGSATPVRPPPASC
jgi:3-hydroxy-3-methylglutaryl CoA synthase